MQGVRSHAGAIEDTSMNDDPTATANHARYDDDFHGWAVEQAQLLRDGRLAAADVANIAEEIESLGRSERRELVNRLAVLLLHLLKWFTSPGTARQELARDDRAAAATTAAARAGEPEPESRHRQRDDRRIWRRRATGGARNRSAAGSVCLDLSMGV
jgi:Domain of unknown function DUF29